MTLSNLSRTVLVALGLALFATPSASLAQSRSGHELVNRPYWSGNGPLTNYDREAHGSDASHAGPQFIGALKFRAPSLSPP
jgi:hypothetical protein